MSDFFQLPTYLLFVIIFFVIIFRNWLGYRYKKKQIELHPGQVQESMGSIEGSILGVMSLLMGFSFSVAVSKFETRRHLLLRKPIHWYRHIALRLCILTVYELRFAQILKNTWKQELLTTQARLDDE